MHWNLRPPDVASVFLRFNYEANAKLVWSRSTYPFLTYVFTADTVCYAVTLTFDHLALNVCSVSAVVINSVPNFSEIEQSAVELLRFRYVQLD